MFSIGDNVWVAPVRRGQPDFYKARPDKVVSVDRDTMTLGLRDDRRVFPISGDYTGDTGAAQLFLDSEDLRATLQETVAAKLASDRAEYAARVAQQIPTAFRK